MREIILDTETTGLDPAQGHRLVEIACVELLNTIPTGATFHAYVDPMRDMPQEAFRIHGLSAEFLKGKPLFEAIASEFLAFIGDTKLVIHNAEFDMKFINAELKRAGLPPLGMDRVFDTLSFARRKHPGSPASLDALCARYRIDNSRRTKHGALLDSEILAEVYTELMGGRQSALVLAADVRDEQPDEIAALGQRPERLGPFLDEERAEAHRQFRATLGEKSFWGAYFSA
jgi:DNA polymerase III subunit epsilon